MCVLRSSELSAESAGRAKACAICKFALFVQQLKVMILINSVQFEDCANFVDCVFLYTRAQNGNALSLILMFFPIWPQCMLVAMRVSVRQTSNA